MKYDYDPDCCEECFSPSHDTNFGRGEVAIPDGCKDEDCECHINHDDCEINECFTCQENAMDKAEMYADLARDEEMGL